MTHLVLGQVVGQVSDHDLSLGRNTILGGTTLLLGAGTGLALLLSSLGISSLGVVGGLSQRSLLGSSGIGGFLTLLSLLIIELACENRNWIS